MDANNEQWPGRPTLLPGESFSSWFARTAVANGLRPAELFRIVQPGEDRNPRDLDRYADDTMLDLLADRTGIGIERLRKATFRRWEGLLFSHDYGDRKLTWLPPAGRQGGNRCYGQQVCPLCLEGDQHPYLRQIWRLAFIATCPLHGCLLHDRCQHCGETLNVLRQNGRDEIRCWACGADVRTFHTDSPAVNVAEVQEELLRRTSQGWWDLGKFGPVYSFAAFDMLALITRLLMSGRHALALRAHVADQEPQLAVPPQSLPRAREGALLGPKARSVLVPMAF